MSTVFTNQLLRVEVTIKDQDGVVVDVSSSSSINFIFRKPSGATITKTASLVTDGTDGKVDYTTVTNDLDEVGEWTMQCVVDDVLGDYPTDIVHINVSKRV